MFQRSSDFQVEFPDTIQEPYSVEEMFKTWSFESDQPMSFTPLGEMVQKELPTSIFHCKDINYAADNLGIRSTLKIVGHRTEISELDKWGELIPRTKIVVIGSANEMELCALTTLFESCTMESWEG